MEEKGFVENGFIVNLSNAQNAAEVIYELSTILEMPETKGKKICLKLEDVNLNQSQLLSIKALIESMDCTLDFIDSDSEETKDSAQKANIQIIEFKNEIEVPEIKPEKIDIDLSHSDVLFENNEDHTAFTELAVEEGLIEKKTYESMEIDDIIKTGQDTEDLSKLTTLYLKQNLRSGQNITYDGHIVLIGDAHPGSEIVARGDISVWGVLGGIAHAGSKGNEDAVIRALKLNGIQLRIANCYARRLDVANIPYIQKEATYTPEEARIDNNQIVITTTFENKEK